MLSNFTFLNCDNFLLHQTIVESPVHIEEAFLRFFDVGDFGVEEGYEVLSVIFDQIFERIGMVVNAEDFGDSIAEPHQPKIGHVCSVNLFLHRSDVELNCLSRILFDFSSYLPFVLFPMMNLMMKKKFIRFEWWNPIFHWEIRNAKLNWIFQWLFHQFDELFNQFSMDIAK